MVNVDGRGKLDIGPVENARQACAAIPHSESPEAGNREIAARTGVQTLRASGVKSTTPTAPGVCSPVLGAI